jgi:hypothetical protein
MNAATEQMPSNAWPVEVTKISRARLVRESGSCRAGMFDLLEQEMAVFACEHEQSLKDVKKNYVASDRDLVESFLTQHRTMPELLLEAAPKLKEWFGNDAVLSLRLVSEDATSATLFGSVVWRGSVADARRALAGFDEGWWLSKMAQAGGRLAFTYELA